MFIESKELEFKIDELCHHKTFYKKRAFYGMKNFKSRK